MDGGSESVSRCNQTGPVSSETNTAAARAGDNEEMAFLKQPHMPSGSSL